MLNHHTHHSDPAQDLMNNLTQWEKTRADRHVIPKEEYETLMRRFGDESNRILNRIQ